MVHHFPRVSLGRSLILGVTHSRTFRVKNILTGVYPSPLGAPRPMKKTRLCRLSTWTASKTVTPKSHLWGREFRTYSLASLVGQEGPGSFIVTHRVSNTKCENNYCRILFLFFTFTPLTKDDDPRPLPLRPPSFVLRPYTPRYVLLPVCQVFDCSFVTL